MSRSERAARAAPRGKQHHQHRSPHGRNKCFHRKRSSFGQTCHPDLLLFSKFARRRTPTSFGRRQDAGRAARAAPGAVPGTEKREATGSSSFEAPLLFSSRKNASWSRSVRSTTVKNREDANRGTIRTFPGRQAVKRNIGGSWVGPANHHWPRLPSDEISNLEQKEGSSSKDFTGINFRNSNNEIRGS